MNYEIKVFDISDDVKTNEIDSSQCDNILKIFNELTKETHLVTNCFLDKDVEGFTDASWKRRNFSCNL